MPSPLPSGLSITWFGHSTFVVQLPSGKRLLIDPFIQGNPSCPPDKKDVGTVDALLISHGHGDHFADAIAIARETGCVVFSNFEIITFMGKQGVANVEPMNKGGSVHREDLGITVTLTHAFHSNGIEAEGGVVYAGEPCGIIVTLDDGFAFYFAGDTAVFSDMALISELYAPKLAFLPIGDRFTMGPKEAAKAVSLMPSVEYIVPMHYGTFPLLTGTPEALRETLTKNNATVEILVPAPGDTLTF